MRPGGTRGKGGRDAGCTAGTVGAGRDCRVAAQSGSRWRLAAFARGRAIERLFGMNLAKKFPTIDRFARGTATSIKSLDLGAKSYASTGRLVSRVRGYINSVANFNGARHIRGAMVRRRELLLVVPKGGTSAQFAALRELVAEARAQGVKLVIRRF